MKTKKIIISLFAATLLCGGLSSCEDFLTTSPSTSVSDGDIVKGINYLDMVLTGAYRYLYFNGDRDYKGQPGYQMYGDLGGADIICTEGIGGSQVTTYRYLATKTSASSAASQIWEKMYNVINTTNIIIDNIPITPGSDAKKDEVLGQALAIRAICYFNLIQNYQKTYAIAKDKLGVILRTSSTEAPGGVRSTVEECYNLIVDDLTRAKTLLAGYNRGSQKYHVDRYVVAGILARVYSVMGNWAAAETEADYAYTQYSTLMTKAQYRAGFADRTVPEVMWAVNQTDETNAGGYDAQYQFWYTRHTADQVYYSYGTYFVSDEYVALFGDTTTAGFRNNLGYNDTTVFSDATTDHRAMFNQIHLVDPYFSYHKWKDPGNGSFQSRGSIPLMRGAEMLLIRAEARANQAGKLTQALADLNTLQIARNAVVTNNSTNPALLEDIYLERRKELLGEGVAGMYDLLRLQKDLVRGNSHPVVGRFTILSNDYRFICQIPAREFELNLDLNILTDQNPASGQ